MREECGTLGERADHKGASAPAAPSYDELVQTLALIRYTTGPGEQAGSNHPAAHGLADVMLKRIEACKMHELRTRAKATA